MNSDKLKDAGMQTNDEIRRARLAMLIAKAGGAAKLAELIKKAPAQISQWINASPDSKTKRPRSMSDDAARDIEECLALGRGWMDQPTTLPESSAQVINESMASSGATLSPALEVVLDAIAASPHRTELRQLLPMLVDTNAQTYRERLHQLLDPPVLPSTVERVIRAKLHAETKDIKPEGSRTDVGSHD